MSCSLHHAVYASLYFYNHNVQIFHTSCKSQCPTTNSLYAIIGKCPYVCGIFIDLVASQLMAWYMMKASLSCKSLAIKISKKKKQLRLLVDSCFVIFSSFRRCIIAIGIVVLKFGLIFDARRGLFMGCQKSALIMVIQLLKRPITPVAKFKPKILTGVKMN